VNAYFLFVFASLWGEPSLAARHWAMRYPDSVRAVTTLATYQMTEESALRAAQTISGFVERQPEHAYLQIQQLNILCRIDGMTDHSSLVRELHRRLPAVDFTYSAGNMLSQLFDASVSTKCTSVSPDTVAALAGSLRNNPRYVQDAQYNQFHYKLLAGITRYQGDTDAALAHLRVAIDYLPSSELNFMMVTALVDLGDFTAARDFMDTAHAAAPRNPLRAIEWHRDLDALAGYVDEMEKQGR
jgi:predicted Zn-dependent protease